jgi:hypothetical protein
MKALGYHLVHYDLTTEDYLHPGRDEIQQSKDLVTDALAKAPGDGNLLSLQHDTIPQSSGNLTELILQLIAAKGWDGTSNLSFVQASFLCLRLGDTKFCILFLANCIGIR